MGGILASGVGVRRGLPSISQVGKTLSSRFSLPRVVGIKFLV